MGTTDLYSSCDTQIPSGWNRPIFGVPLNASGFQLAHTGNNYIGLVAWAKSTSFPNSREYAQIKLLDTLIPGKTYCVSYYASRADSASDYATSRLGCYLSASPPSSSTQYLLNNSPQMQNAYNNYVIDSTNWKEMSGLYTASSNEQYLTIGNFFDDATTDTLFMSFHNSAKSYYYIDDISVVEYESADAGADTVVCAGNPLHYIFPWSLGASYNWSTISGDLSSIDSLSSPSPTFSPTLTTTYVLAKKQCGITSYDTLLIRVPVVNKAIVPADTTVCAGDTIVIVASNNCPWCTHSWSTGDTSIQVQVIPYKSLAYTFIQHDSCFTTSASLALTVMFCSSPNIVVPNFFSPNSDEINDVWTLQVDNEFNLIDFKIIIFNRWGLKVFETTEIKQGWDGYTTSGLICNEGTYYCTIEYYNLHSAKKSALTGFIQLIR